MEYYDPNTLRMENSMRISDVESKVVGAAHYVRIVTEDGLVGIGQSGCWAYPHAVDSVITAFRSYLIGQDSRKIEHHWNHLYRMGPFRGAVLTSAVSAVDIALWDLAGKRLNAPVYELLGGPTRDRIRLHLLLSGSTTDEIVPAAREALALGFTAVKLDPLPRNVQDLSAPRLVAAATEVGEAVRATVGPEVDIIFELHRKLSPLQAQPVMQALTAFNPLFIEDPIQIDSLSQQAAMASRHAGPVGAGERLHTIWEFSDLLNLGGAQYVRPDLGTGGGISHVKKIAAIAEAHHSVLVTHNCLGPVLTAAAAHIDAAVPNAAVQEYSLVDEQMLSSGAISSGFTRDGGWLTLSLRPGLGVDVDWDRIPHVDLVGRAIHDIPLRADGSVAYAV